jgi:hypothetical protein
MSPLLPCLLLSAAYQVRTAAAPMIAAQDRDIASGAECLRLFRAGLLPLHSLRMSSFTLRKVVCFGSLDDMPEPTITASPDGSTISWTCTREQAIAIAVATQDRKIELAEPVLRALIGSPAWKQQTGEGTPGPLSQAEVAEFRLTNNYPEIP